MNYYNYHNRLMKRVKSPIYFIYIYIFDINEIFYLDSGVGAG